MKAWQKLGALVIRTLVSTVLLSLLMYTFFACVDVKTFTTVAEMATADPVGTTWLFVPIVVILCLSVMLCYLVVNPPKSDCVCTKKAEPKAEVKEEKKTVKKAPAKKAAAKTTKKSSKK